MGLDGRVALVTGGSRGIGRGIALALAEDGADVAVNYNKDAEAAEETAEAIRALGRRAMVVRAAVESYDDDKAMVDAVLDELGPIGILVNNAGVGGEGLALDISIEDFDATFDVNVRGTFFAAREAAKRMIAAKVEGRIVNIASIASHTVLPGLSAYCGSKAAVAMLTRSLAREWARRGIAVNALAPGYIETAINDAWWPTEGGQKQLKGFPRRRLMDADELDEAFLLLCGPGARAMTGSLITVDDGQSLPGGG